MTRIILTAAVLSTSATALFAGALERSTFNSGLLFEDGDYVELSFGIASPDVSGTVGGGTVSSGDMAQTYLAPGFGYKQQFNDTWSMALIIDQPIGADVSYPAATPTNPYPFGLSTADVDSQAITALGKYTGSNNVSFYGGIKAQRVSGKVFIPLFGNYSLATNKDMEYGYVVGAAWEKPEIAARVSLTYTSEITHTFDSIENGTQTPGFDSTVPQSVQLDFQTGVAADTLVFGSVRWVDWSEFEILPPAFSLGSGGLPLAAYDSDYITYSLGVGRRFSDTWSGAITLTHEPSTDDLQRNLGPTDGFSAISVGATYTRDNIKVTGGLRYALVGDATTTTVGADFSDNKALALGLKVGYSF